MRPKNETPLLVINCSTFRMMHSIKDSFRKYLKISLDFFMDDPKNDPIELVFVALKLPSNFGTSQPQEI